jgi:2-dehydropantoate 2-reductase
MTSSILIWGAGAIGGTIGAALARAGHNVTLVDTEADHVAAINANGLHISGPVETYVARPQAHTPQTLTGSYRLILLAVKAHHTAAATRMLLGHLAQDGIVVSCQNGLNELIISSIVGRDRTIGAFVNFGADWTAPGEIMFGNRGAVVVGELNGRTTPRLSALHKLLLDFEANAAITDNIWGYLWGKTGYGIILKASALTNDTIADFIAAPANRTLIKSLVLEMMNVAAAEGVVPLGFNGFDPEAFATGDAAGLDRSCNAMVDFNRRSAKSRSGIWRDLAVRHRQTDAGAQLAPVVAAAARHGIATPITDRLIATIAAVERGEATIGDNLVAQLIFAL